MNLKLSCKEREVSYSLCELASTLTHSPKLMCVHYGFNILIKYFSFIHAAHHVLFDICLYYQLI